jgi:Flp pilus assembly protein TadD
LTAQDLANRLSPDQKQVFQQGSTAFNEHRYGDALSLFKKLLTEVPGDAVLSKFACESALYVGDSAFALTALKPIAAGKPE